MDSTVNLDKAKEIINDGMAQASSVLGDKEQIAEVLKQVQTKLDEVPLIGDAVKDAPVMVSMIKSYATKEYTAVSPKSAAAVVSAFLYLIKRKDLIPDSIPVFGLLDDIAVAAVALKLAEPDLAAYTKWKEGTSEPEQA